MAAAFEKIHRKLKLLRGGRRRQRQQGKEKLCFFWFILFLAVVVVGVALYSSIDVTLPLKQQQQYQEDAMLLPQHTEKQRAAVLVEPNNGISSSTNHSTAATTTTTTRATTTRATTRAKQEKIVRLDLVAGKRNTELGLIDIPNHHHHHHHSPLVLEAHLFNLSQQPVTSTAPWPNLTTMAFYEGKFRSGYRNQMMAFTMVVLQTVQQGHGQLLLNSLAQKDTYGSNKFIPFSKLWNVTHWNSYYPQLPRLVEYDPILHDQYNPNPARKNKNNDLEEKEEEEQQQQQQQQHAKKENHGYWFRNGTQFENHEGTLQTNLPVRPHAYGKQHRLMAAYMHYAKGKGPQASTTTAATATNSNTEENADSITTSTGGRNPLEILMLREALRPHPDLETIIQEKLQLLRGGGGNSNNDKNDNKGGTSNPNPNDYMTLHARVEPDMQRHPVCRDKKVLNLTTIFEFLESKWKDDPPYDISRIFMPINRQYLEQEGIVPNNNVTTDDKKKKKEKKKKKVNWMAIENLNALNRARDHGLWGGRVRVYEFGASTLVGTPYESKPSTPGAMLNFFIGIQAKIFVGTEVSSYSHDLLATRFFRGYRQDNYKYLPEGLVEWTPPHIHDPPGFGC